MLDVKLLAPCWTFLDIFWHLKQTGAMLGHAVVPARVPSLGTGHRPGFSLV